MLIAVTQAGATYGIGGGSTTWKVTFLTLLAVGTYLAMAWPGKLRNERLARTGQLAVGGFLIMSTFVAGMIVAAQAAGIVAWFADDDLASPATLVLISLLALIGAQLLMHSTQKLANSSISLGCMAAIPTTILGIFDTVVLAYLWLGRPEHAAWSTDRDGALVFAGVTAVVAAVIVLVWCTYVLRSRDVRPGAGRAMFVAAMAASQAAVLMIVHGAGHVAYQSVGVDLLFCGTLMGTAVFLVAMLAEDTAAAAPRTATATPGDASARPAPMIELATREETHAPVERVPAPEDLAA